MMNHIMILSVLKRSCLILLIVYLTYWQKKKDVYLFKRNWKELDSLFELYHPYIKYIIARLWFMTWSLRIIKKKLHENYICLGWNFIHENLFIWDLI